MGEVVQMLEGITKIRKPPNPKAAGEGAFDEDVGGGNVSVFPNFVDSTMARSSSSSFQIVQTSSFHLERNLERASSSLLSVSIEVRRAIPKSISRKRDYGNSLSRVVKIVKTCIGETSLDIGHPLQHALIAVT
ncbi:hypothetical protein C3L33_21679, partial [Rhododendron williamsianum]